MEYTSPMRKFKEAITAACKEPAPDDVGSPVIVVSLQSEPDEQGVERTAGLPDESFSDFVFIGAGRFPDCEQTARCAGIVSHRVV